MASVNDFKESIQDLRSKIKRTAEVVRGSEIEVQNYNPDEHGPLVTYEGVEEYEEVERYWVNAPFAFISINFDPERNENIYHVVEPELSEFEYVLLENLFDDIRNSLVYRAQLQGNDPENILKQEMKNLLEEYGVKIGMRTFYRIFYYINRSFRGYGKIDALMHDPRIEDISCNGYDLPVFIYHQDYTNLRTNVIYGEDELDSFVVRLAQRSGRPISTAEPLVGATLPDGSRVELDYEEEVSPRGSAFTIRKYGAEPFTPSDLVKFGTFDLEQMAYLWLAIENNKSLIFAGGTASGKTTSMNAVSMFIPPLSKVVSVEDTREIVLYRDNWLAGVTREMPGQMNDISMFGLLRSALRHRPEYIIVGEVRGEEAMTLFQAMNTGHTNYSTMHADSIQTVINRLENEPLNVPRSMVQSLDIVSVQAMTSVEGGRVRRTKWIYEIEGIDPGTGELIYSTVSSWDPQADVFSMRESQILEEIQEEHGWSRSELLREMQNRKKVLRYLRQEEVTPARFSAVINEYHLRPEKVMERVERSLNEEPKEESSAGEPSGEEPSESPGKGAGGEFPGGSPGEETGAEEGSPPEE